MHRRMGQRGRACVAKDKVQDVQVLAAEDVSVATLAVRVAVHDGRGGSGEHEHVYALGHISACNRLSVPLQFMSEHMPASSWDRCVVLVLLNKAC